MLADWSAIVVPWSGSPLNAGRLISDCGSLFRFPFKCWQTDQRLCSSCGPAKHARGGREYLIDSAEIRQEKDFIQRGSHWFLRLNTFVVTLTAASKGSSGWWRPNQYSTVHVQHSVMQYNTVQYNAIQYSVMQYNTVQYNLIQYSVLQYNTMQYNTA